MLAADQSAPPTRKPPAPRVVLPRPRSAPTAVVPRTVAVVALVPAHNEEAGIVGTVRSLYGQTRPPDRVIVVADNCTDATVEFARAAGAEVVETMGNRHRKAGALNQALAAVLPDLQDGDVVLAMDADSQLPPTSSRPVCATSRTPPNGGPSAVRTSRVRIARLSACYSVSSMGRASTGLHSRGGRIHVLSGAACMFTAQALRAVAWARGSALLPGPRGWIYHQESLTEDYEL